MGTGRGLLMSRASWGMGGALSPWDHSTDPKVWEMDGSVPAPEGSRLPSPTAGYISLGIIRARSALDHTVQLVCFHCLFLLSFSIFLQGSYCRFDLIFLLN